MPSVVGDNRLSVVTSDIAAVVLITVNKKIPKFFRLMNIKLLIQRSLSSLRLLPLFLVSYEKIS